MITTSDGKELLRVNYNTFNFTIGTCRVNTYDSNVNFNDITMQLLKDTGATSDTVNFNVNISCGSAGMTPAITFSGDTDSEYTNVFTNPSGDGYAQGVGVQILKENSIITPGENISLGATSTSGSADYEFSGRVFSLAQTTTSGEIDIPIYFTLTYE